MDGLNHSVITGKCSGCAALRAKLKAAREQLGALEAVGVPHSISLGGVLALKCYHWCYACSIDRILHPKEANGGQA